MLAQGRYWCGLLLALLAVNGCGLLSKSSAPKKTSLSAIQVIAEPGANQNSATALDIVFVYDTATVDLLPKSGPTWFENKTRLLSAFPKGIDVVSLQLPPALTVAPVALPARYRDAVRTLAFANYVVDAGQYPMDLTAFKHAVVRLQPTGIVFGEK